MPRPKWTKQSSDRYWRQRPFHVAWTFANLMTQEEEDAQNGCASVQRGNRTFYVLFESPEVRPLQITSSNIPLTTYGFARNTRVGRTAQRCGSLQSKKLLPAYRKRLKPTSSTSCNCTARRYHVPDPRRVPAVIQNLTLEEIYTLRPFRAFSGRYNRVMFGYRVCEEPFKIKWAQEDVESKKRKIADPVSRGRTKAAFDFLMTKGNCSYKKFILVHRSHVREPWIFELFSHPAFHGIEAALWPNLYYENSLCESYLEGQQSRKSGKVSFMTKISSAVCD